MVVSDLMFDAPTMFEVDSADFFGLPALEPSANSIVAGVISRCDLVRLLDWGGGGYLAVVLAAVQRRLPDRLAACTR